MLRGIYRWDSCSGLEFANLTWIHDMSIWTCESSFAGLLNSLCCNLMKRSKKWTDLQSTAIWLGILMGILGLADWSQYLCQILMCDPLNKNRPSRFSEQGRTIQPCVPYVRTYGRQDLLKRIWHRAGSSPSQIITFPWNHHHLGKAYCFPFNLSTSYLKPSEHRHRNFILVDAA